MVVVLGQSYSVGGRAYRWATRKRERERETVSRFFVHKRFNILGRPDRPPFLRDAILPDSSLCRPNLLEAFRLGLFCPMVHMGSTRRVSIDFRSLILGETSRSRVKKIKGESGDENKLCEIEL